MLHAVERIERAAARAGHPRRRACARSPRSIATRGSASSEAPRGTLIHHYRVDDDGIVQWANLVIATGHNNLAMNRSVAPGREALRQERPADRADAQPGRGGHPLLRPVPVLLDPRARRDALHLQLIGPDGAVLDELIR